MKLINKITVLFTICLLFCATAVSAAGNPIDSDLSNTAGSNSGKSHLDIYIFIVALLVLCVIVPFFEKKKDRAS
jgi:hypothetical protein